MTAADLLDRLPPPWPDGSLQGKNRDLARASGRTIVAIDDDPTGTQTVFDVPVITRWDTPHLGRAFARGEPLVYVLSNSRSFDAGRAAAMNREIVSCLKDARKTTGRDFTVISRSDSTLRGHYPAETDALARALGTPDATTLLVPFFEEGGRFTVDDVHYVVEGGTATPAAATPFADDPVFGFRNADLRRWVEEKTDGTVRAGEVGSVDLTTIRTGGPEAVANILRDNGPAPVAVVNAVTMRDVEVVANAVHHLHTEGRQFLFRTAASFVRALAGLPKRDLLTPEEVVSPGGEPGGLIVVGSHVPKTTRQLHALESGRNVRVVELDVRAALDPATFAKTVDAASSQVGEGLATGRDVVLFTSRELATADGDDAKLDIARTVSRALVGAVRRLPATPRFLIAKGGITSSDIATGALGVSEATVVGQLIPGVPVWRLGDETRFPGLGFVVFPGNVGDDNALADAVAKLSNQ